MRSRLLAILFTSACLSEAMADDYVEKQCPVIGNTKSKIYHVPGNLHYSDMLKQNKTGEENRKCFPNEDAAKKSGYRAAKS